MHLAVPLQAWTAGSVSVLTAEEFCTCGFCPSVRVVGWLLFLLSEFWLITNLVMMAEN